MTSMITVIAVRQSRRAIIGLVLVEPTQACEAQRTGLRDARASLWVR